MTQTQQYKELPFVITDYCVPKKTGAEAALDMANSLEKFRHPKVRSIYAYLEM